MKIAGVKKTVANTDSFETDSAKRIIDALDYFTVALQTKDEAALMDLLKTVTGASCTTHLVQKTADAVQMFLFQNNRGKKPTDLEVIKAEFMYQVHLHGGKETDALLAEITNRFESIYKNISTIGGRVDEDDILLYTQRVFFNSLDEEKPVAKVNDVLADDRDGEDVAFILSFTLALDNSFSYLKTFINESKTNDAFQSFVVLTGCRTWAMPFIIKAYQFGLPSATIGKLCNGLENILLRHTLVGTRGELDNRARFGGVFKGFTEDNKSIDGILDFVEKLKQKNEKNWLNWWNNEELEKALVTGKVGMGTAKYILWRYENYLLNQGHNGYSFRYDSITPNTEHIAPKTEPKEGGGVAGYDEYNEEFKEQYLDSIGNYLLLSEEHNISIGNGVFQQKWNDYTHLAQQRTFRIVISALRKSRNRH
ncbi:hypothetical protein FACS189427_13300 [Planctomycetales bacterium]|nr:hypothetical protein FACS189427_13300 [Planctomycetales bacterium]